MNITPQHLVKLLKSNIIEKIKFIEERGFVQWDMGDSGAYWKRDAMYLNFDGAKWKAKSSCGCWSAWEATPMKAIEELRKSIAFGIKRRQEELNGLNEAAAHTDELVKGFSEECNGTQNGEA